MFRLITQNSYLLGQLVKKDISEKYKGSVLGILWSLLIPILMLGIYTFVFSEVFQARWDMDTSNPYQFALVLFCGLSAFNLISDVMSRSASLIASNVNYVKKVIFPLELLPVVITLSALFNCIISYIILIAANYVLNGAVSHTLYQILLCFIPLLILAVGLGLLISAVSVYLKDVGNAISVLITILMYLSPVFFPLSSVPDKFKYMCNANPMTYIIENFRNVTLYNCSIDLRFWIISCIASLVIYMLGFAVFKRAKEGFADVL